MRKVGTRGSRFVKSFGVVQRAQNVRILAFNYSVSAARFNGSNVEAADSQAMIRAITEEQKEVTNKVSCFLANTKIIEIHKLFFF